jgi:hypothetical protein
MVYEVFQFFLSFGTPFDARDEVPTAPLLNDYSVCFQLLDGLILKNVMNEMLLTIEIEVCMNLKALTRVFDYPTRSPCIFSMHTGRLSLGIHGHAMARGN